LKAECSMYFLAQELIITNIDIFNGRNDNILQDLDDNLIYRSGKPYFKNIVASGIIKFLLKELVNKGS
jgi:hypothetical protein